MQLLSKAKDEVHVLQYYCTVMTIPSRHASQSLQNEENSGWSRVTRGPFNLMKVNSSSGYVYGIRR